MLDIDALTQIGLRGSGCEHKTKTLHKRLVLGKTSLVVPRGLATHIELSGTLSTHWTSAIRGVKYLSRSTPRQLCSFFCRIWYAKNMIETPLEYK